MPEVIKTSNCKVRFTFYSRFFIRGSVGTAPLIHKITLYEMSGKLHDSTVLPSG